MRLGRKETAVLVGIILTATVIWSLSTVVKRTSLTPPESSSGYRLVSIQEVPDAGEICLPPERDTADSNLFASFDKSHENDLLALLQGTSVYAASQESGQTVEVNRQPVRRPLDTDPGYGYIAFVARTGIGFLHAATM